MGKSGRDVARNVSTSTDEFMQETLRWFGDPDPTAGAPEEKGRLLFICDYHIEAGRLCSTEDKKDAAAEHFQSAKKLIDETGYERRRKELKDNC